MTETMERDDVELDVPEPVAAPAGVEIRRSSLLAALLGGAASAVAIAYLGRAASGGGVLDWALAGGMALLGALWLVALVDARTPLLVADGHGLRIRLGRSWTGLPWGALARVEHLPRRGLLGDGRLVPVPYDPDLALTGLDGRARRRSRFAARWYGGPLAVPLGLATRVAGAPDGLGEALARLAGPLTPVVEVRRTAEEAPEEAPEEADPSIVELGDDPAAAGAALDPAVALAPAPALEPPGPAFEPAGPAFDPAFEPALEMPVGPAGEDMEGPEPGRRRVDPRPAVAHGIGTIASLLGRRDAGGRGHADHATDLTLGATALDPAAADAPGRDDLPEATELRPGAGAEGEGWMHRLLPLNRRDVVELDAPVELDEAPDSGRSPVTAGADVPAVLDAPAAPAQPAPEPMIGPVLARARTRLQLSVDGLAERTRIRPHVIESIEADDFAPCGGDFYARGHLRTLARILGVDVAPLLASYDAHHAQAPIDARRVFEAELATASIHGTRGGPNWSVLVAAVMALVLAWSVARLVMDAPIELRQPAPVLNGSGGLNNGAPQGDPVPVVLTADRGVRLMVRDGTGEIAFTGDLAIGQSQRVSVVYPIRVTASDGGAVSVSVAGEDKGEVGEDDTPAEVTYVAD